MKARVITIACLILALSLTAAGIASCTWFDRQTQQPADKTNDINTLLIRPEGWQTLDLSAEFSERDIAQIDGSTATIPITAELLRQFCGQSDRTIQNNLIVFHSTTHNAYTQLIDRGTRHIYNNYDGYGEQTDGSVPVNLILVTPPSEEEKQYAKDRGVELELTPVARDGFAFIVNRANRVDSLTVEQIQDIYTGKITNWSRVGGSDRAIKAYQRNANSGSQTAMEQLVMQGKPMMKPPSTKQIGAMGMLIEAVAAEYDNGQGSIGYSYYYYLNNLYKNDHVKVLKVNGVTPDNENLISGAYPFSTSYYAVIRADEPADSPARRLRDFLISEDGQRLVEQAGYCRGVD